MRKIWHRIVGHRWRTVCRLCVQSRYHVDGHEPYQRCSCGETRDA